MSQDQLRKDAEKIFRNKKTPGISGDTNPLKILEELQIYQIELELQNEELRRSSEELVKSQKRFSDLFEHAPVGYLILDSNFVVVNVNQSAALMLKQIKEKITGKSLHKYIHPNFQDSFYFLMQNALSRDILFNEELKLVTEYGTGFYAQLQAIRDFDTTTGALMIRVVMIDINERKGIEKEFKRFRAALDSSADNIFLIDYDSGQFIDVNQSATDLLGYSREEFLKMKPVDLNPAYTSEFLGNIKNQHLYESGKSITLEVKHPKKNGEIIDAEIFLKTLRIEDENIIVAVARDITERKKNENKLAQYARDLEELNTSKNKFLSIISHDLRGPFLGLKGYTQMLIEEYDLLEKEEILDYLARVHESSRDLYTLVDNLLKWSRLELGKIPYEPMSFNLYDELESLMKLLTGIAEKKEIRLINEIEKDIYPFADRLMLISIVQNLVGNAIKFTRKNGFVKISTISGENEITVSVHDNGVGMSPEVLEKLFTLDISHTSRGTSGEKGTGFGLIITKEMIKKMGGTLTVSSKMDEGTTFSFTLQRSDYNSSQ